MRSFRVRFLAVLLLAIYLPVTMASVWLHRHEHTFGRDSTCEVAGHSHAGHHHHGHAHHHHHHHGGHAHQHAPSETPHQHGPLTDDDCLACQLSAMRTLTPSVVTLSHVEAPVQMRSEPQFILPAVAPAEVPLARGPPVVG